MKTNKYSKWNHEYLSKQVDKIEKLVLEALETDGAHHKQWFLAEIAKALQIDLDDVDEGVAP